eukprot:CAMPEP_0114385194 /NCGR_PEP_ID=MMETSP0102-20121206/5842_1 /TAXON_ID=38822 ORGANISM="Pteridomonas danica, Strain PT" /NCGR_SAMPLE_ID=MMETSP0102 /ASSEMBLY_ACC=CAM_ASM_000212 /LENGTH=345 /DNA_ID=CAMNT_0001541705 /DNA_START=1 /DNA_END=1035 /DNA_ORIENTATION=+
MNQWYYLLPLFYVVSSQNVKDLCSSTLSLTRDENQISYLAVLALKSGEDIQWVNDFPIPIIVYSNNPTSEYKSPEGAMPSSVFVKFIIEHYACLPRWGLFLHSDMDNHPLNPSITSALLDLDTIDRGYLSLGHMPRSAAALASMHPASEGFSAAAPFQSHRAAFVAVEEGRVGCECFIMRELLSSVPGVSGSLNFDAAMPPNCERPFSWQPGSTFWASSRRIHGRPLESWKHIYKVLVTDEVFEVEDTGKISSFAAECVESTWHFLLGEPIYHYKPLFEYFEELPLVSKQTRCTEAHSLMCEGRSDKNGLGHAAAQPGGATQASRSVCSATHGEMDGDDVGVATW